MTAAAIAHEVLDEAKARAEAETRGPRPACSAGCSFCCHVHVEAGAPELVLIARFLRRSLSDVHLAAFRARLAIHVARVDALSDEARWAARVPCALLDERGRCTVYPVRPLRCRAFYSCSAEACRAAFDGASDSEPVENGTLSLVLDAVEGAYDRALECAGHPVGGVRLERGLLGALDEDGAS